MRQTGQLLQIQYHDVENKQKVASSLQKMASEFLQTKRKVISKGLDIQVASTYYLLHDVI